MHLLNEHCATVRPVRLLLYFIYFLFQTVLIIYCILFILNCFDYSDFF